MKTVVCVLLLVHEVTICTRYNVIIIVPDTFAESHLSLTATEQGAAAKQAADSE